METNEMTQNTGRHDGYGHHYDFDKSVLGYGICECGARENSEMSVRDCPVWRSKLTDATATVDTDLDDRPLSEIAREEEEVGVAEEKRAELEKAVNDMTDEVAPGAVHWCPNGAKLRKYPALICPLCHWTSGAVTYTPTTPTTEARMSDRFRRWLVCWGYLIDGITGVLTFSFWQSDVSTRAAKSLAKWRFQRREDPAP